MKAFMMAFFCLANSLKNNCNQKLIETKKVLLYLKISKLVKYGANFVLFFKIGYFRGIKVTIGAK